MHFEILQTNSKLNQTTTILLHLIYDYNPPKRIAKFKNIFLSGIMSNTFRAGTDLMPIPKIGEDQVLTEPLQQPWTLLSPHPSSATTCPGQCVIKSPKPCHAVAWHATIMPPSPLAISGPNHRVNSLPLTHLMLPSPSHDHLSHSNGQKTPCTVAPRHAQTRARTRVTSALDAPER
jgi:hypothetical protein